MRTISRVSSAGGTNWEVITASVYILYDVYTPINITKHRILISLCEMIQAWNRPGYMYLSTLWAKCGISLQKKDQQKEVELFLIEKKLYLGSNNRY